MKQITQSAQETMDFAKSMLAAHPDCKLWLLSGDLGSGKTTFVKGLSQSLGLDEKEVKSPTFTFVNRNPHFLHYDLYRLEQEDPILREQIWEDLQAGYLLLIEWPERMPLDWPQKTLHLQFQHEGENQRSIFVTER